MLIELSIKNFAIIDHLTIPFDKGLTVLTGETGAGKSIIIDAIGLLVGGRGSSEFVRYGMSKAEIEGLFSVHKHHPAVQKSLELGIECEEEMIIIRREISANGKSICRVNGKLVTLGILREIGQTLVDIHGQHEHQVLLQPEFHLSLLDNFAQVSLNEPLKEYKELYTTYTEIQYQLKQMSRNEQELTHRLDLIQYQLSEIEQAKLQPNEDEDLLLERRKLANSEKLYKALHDSYNSLYGEGKGLDWLNNALNHLEEAKNIDPGLNSFFEAISSSYYLMEETAFSLSNELEKIEFNPERLEEIETRLNEINQLKRKYGTSVSAILEYGNKIAEELNTLVNKDDHIKQMENELQQTRAKLIDCGKRLTDIRKTAAKELTEKIHEQLKALYMDKTRFAIDFGYTPENELEEEHIRFTSNGLDQIEFQLSTNPGEPQKSLAKIASGGEISRIMLALKTIFTNHQGVTSLIFDEVDTGVSGRVAQAIGEKIYNIAAKSQVLCITHLPQVAAMADHHLFISKEQTEKSTKTSVTPLSPEKKVDEIARMIAGVEVTDITLKHANELLSLAEKMKSKT